MAVESITMLSLTGSVVGYMTILPSQGTGKHDCIIVAIATIATHSINVFFIPQIKKLTNGINAEKRFLLSAGIAPGQLPRWQGVTKNLVLI